MPLTEIPVLNFQVLQGGHFNIQLKDKRLGVIEVKQTSQLLDLYLITSIQEYEYEYTTTEGIVTGVVIGTKKKEVTVTGKFCCVTVGSERLYTSLSKDELMKLIEDEYRKHTVTNYEIKLNESDSNLNELEKKVLESMEVKQIEQMPLTHDKLVEISKSVTAEDLFN